MNWKREPRGVNPPETEAPISLGRSLLTALLPLGDGGWDKELDRGIRHASRFRIASRAFRQLRMRRGATRNRAGHARSTRSGTLPLSPHSVVCNHAAGFASSRLALTRPRTSGTSYDLYPGAPNHPKKLSTPQSTSPPPTWDPHSTASVRLAFASRLVQSEWPFGQRCLFFQ